MDQLVSPDYSARHLSFVTVGLLILLCVGILMQTLGMTITLWDPAATADSADPLTTSVLEGFAIPSTLTMLSFLPHPVPLLTVLSPLRSFLLASEPFHPPVR